MLIPKSLSQILIFPEKLLGDFPNKIFLLIFCKKQQKVLPDFGTNSGTENIKNTKFELGKV